MVVRHGSSRELSAAGRDEPGGCVSFSLRRGAERHPGGRRRPGEQGTARPLSPFIRVNLVPNAVVYALRLYVHTGNSPLENVVLKFVRIALHVRNRSFLLSNGTSCLQPCSCSSHGSSPHTR